MGKGRHIATHATDPSARFELLELVGAGGMAEVYRARLRGTVGFERIVALKMLRPELADDSVQRDLLAREAQLLSRLDHPSIVQALDFLDVGGRATIVLEHVRGPDLRVLLERACQARLRLPPTLVVGIARDVLSGLAHAADVAPGLVHGDVSPGNIMVSRSGAVKLVDFGVATTAPDASIRGKPAYFSPEIVSGLVPDVRSDLFALATVLWESLTLRRLFKHADDAQTLRNIRDVSIEDRLGRHDTIPESLAPILVRAFARDPNARFQSARDFAKALARWLDETTPHPILGESIAELVTALFPPDAMIPVSRATGPVFSPKVDVEPPPLPAAALDLSVLEDAIAMLEARPESESFADIALGRWLDPVARFVDEPTPARGALTPPVPEGFTPLGRLDPLTFPAIIIGLVLKRETGAIGVVDGARRKTIYIAQGKLLHVASNVDTELLGRQLTSSGIISSATAESALELARSSGVRLGQALVNLQATTSEGLASALERQLVNRFLDVFSWSGGRVTFDRGRGTPLEDATSLAMEPLSLVAACLREQWSEARLRRLLAPLADTDVRWIDAPRDASDLFGLSVAERSALELLRRGVTVGHIVGQGRAACFTLFLAIQSGFARLVRPPLEGSIVAVA